MALALELLPGDALLHAPLQDGGCPRAVAAGSTCDLDPTAPGRWRALYDDTFLDGFETAPLDEEPLEAHSRAGAVPARWATLRR